MNTNTIKLNPRQIGIIVLTIATALIHLFLAAVFPPMRLLFILNGVGFLALLVSYFLPQLSNYRNLINGALITFAAVTVVGYFVVNGIKPDPLGWITKLIEIALIVLLGLDRRE